nr:HAMP domain-containing histidine kinase [Bacilli bacterium]
MKLSITMKVAVTFTILSLSSLALAGYLTNGGIKNYVIATTQNNLIAEGNRIIQSYELYGNLITSSKKVSLVVKPSALRIAQKNIAHEYVVIDAKGKILWNTFTQADLHLLTQMKSEIKKAFQGKTAIGLYPQTNPIIAFAAIPFSYTITVPISSVLSPLKPNFFSSQPPLIQEQSTKVVALFTRVADLNQVTLQIWMPVVRSILVATMITLMLGVFMMRWLMRPSKKIRQMIEQVRKRDFSEVAILATGDEWETISQAIAEMVTSLKNYDDVQKRFVQNASHELKTPLMAIRGYAEGLKDGVFDQEEINGILDIVVTETVRLKKLVDELIYLSKLEALEAMYHFEFTSVEKIVRQAISLLKPLAKARQIDLMWQQNNTDVLLYLDGEKMEQAIINMIDNAIRHARSRVIVDLYVESHVYIVIEDDGEGFAKADEQRVFERFYHGAQGDTGLGLAIAKAIVEKHYGMLQASQGSMGGARFVIVLSMQTGG